jgi:putative pyruvate formate lyase activating enzyme
VCGAALTVAAGASPNLNLRDQADFFRSHLEHCMLCPRRCGVNRLKGEIGTCGADGRLKIASYCLHRGEEPPISGKRGSGTVFFSHCSMSCVYCQNYPISQLGYGNVVEASDLVRMMLELQARGAHNVNLVTATHYLPHVVEAIAGAREGGLKVPIVLNTSGYERPETIMMLDGVIQVYLVDMRYARSESAARYSCAPDYPEYNRAALKAMLATAGPLVCRKGLAVKGVIVRHLLIPSLRDETTEILNFISRELPPSVPVSLMTQYFPANRAFEYPLLNRKITSEEYRHALDLLEELGIAGGWVQDPDSVSQPVT